MEKELKPYWTEQAIKQLKEISIITRCFSVDIAQKRVQPIIEQVKRLAFYPLLGKKEEAYMGMKYPFRSLIEGDYKIVYYLKEDYLYVVAIFDCRQDPSWFASDVGVKKAVGVKNKEVTCFLQVLFGYIGDLSYICRYPLKENRMIIVK